MQSEKTEIIFLREFTRAILNTFAPVQPAPQIVKPVSPPPVIKQITPPIVSQPTPAAQPQKPAQPQQTPKEMPEIEGMEKLKGYMEDPSIKTIECPGPDKQIMINRNGVNQPTHITLSKKEIKMILDDFSERTRIPIIPGIFKAKIGNIIITAVVSDYVGTRFIIQKLEPKQIPIAQPQKPAQPQQPIQQPRPAPQAYRPQLPAQPQQPIQQPMPQQPQGMPQRPKF